ncbi:NADH-dependent alcohol dehydrogenase [Arcobacter sp. CECT 8986]|uniref:iron-containing alcohol dehydrogenase n=1 Tax=Arcobacter sp. CECT 8986 TaxID=2044507 RepID=UPI0010099240|nr:iron-containing alcohol dehydrogenase [Arcobacter sp. CECT 8986]RXK01289.1 NADH-dependent alcohol dehydrogenase [Arcobacter sp. CECT 8986]
MTFSYYNPTAIEFGVGKISEISKYIPKKSNVLFVYGGGSIKKNGIYKQVIEALKNFNFFEFSGVEPNPSVETMNKALSIVKDEQIDYILAVGGGSVIDGCKYLAAAALYDGDAWDFLDGKKQVEKALPIGVILTLPATGSESNSLSVVSKKSTNDKRLFASDFIHPKFAVLDPSVMSTLDDRQLKNGLVDAFVHTCEQYLTMPNNSLVHDGYSETILRGLTTLMNTWENKDDKDWRDNLMLLANQALNGFIGCGVVQDWATHFIGHEITAYYGLDHARSLAVVQPHLLRVMFEDKKDKLEQMGKNVFAITDANKVIDKIESLYNNLGVSTKLSDYKVDDKVIENITESLKKHQMLKLGENHDITIEKVKEILQKSLA